MARTHYLAQCQNDRTCLSKVSSCETDGRREDQDEPTDDHSQDFSCQCVIGYAGRVAEVYGLVTKSYVDVPECPEGTGKPGSCADLVNGYDCHCPAGRYEAKGEAPAHTCLAKEGGEPKAVKNATMECAGSVLFRDAFVDYSCGEGALGRSTASS